MNETERIKLFEEATALLSGHFLLASGLHADKYVAKRRLYVYPLKVKRLCQEIAEYFKDSNVEAVVSPAVGGVALSQWVAFSLAELTGREVLAVFAEKVGDKKEFGFSEGCGDFLADKRTLIVDDVLTTGGSIDAVRKAVTEARGVVIAVGILWLRAKEKAEMDVPFFSLIVKAFPAWKPGECPLCVQNIPFNQLK